MVQRIVEATDFFQANPAIRRGILSRGRKCCSVCGAKSGCRWESNPNRRVKLLIEYQTPPSQGGVRSVENLRVICNECEEGRRSLRMKDNSWPQPRPSRVKLLSQIRRATIDDQHAVLEWLLRKFGMANPNQ